MLELQEAPIDSTSVGDPEKFLPLEGLHAHLRDLPAAPRDHGRVLLLVRRGEGGRRETPQRVELSLDSGMPGDAWSRKLPRKEDAQFAVMQGDVAGLIANGQPLTLFGDNLFLDLDLSAANLPLGSRLRVGGATLVVTAEPHNGCAKFRARFGADALRLVSQKDLRPLNLRGIYLRTVEAGAVAVDDAVQVISRGA